MGTCLFLDKQHQHGKSRRNDFGQCCRVCPCVFQLSLCHGRSHRKNGGADVRNSERAKVARPRRRVPLPHEVARHLPPAHRRESCHHRLDKGGRSAQDRSPRRPRASDPLRRERRREREIPRSRLCDEMSGHSCSYGASTEGAGKGGEGTKSRRQKTTTQIGASFERWPPRHQPAKTL
eukprot:Amastigsp_a841293_130.p1 type:complete len:178 gc:universal Amastigsp_a841293_130:662-129(-)